MTKGLTAFGVGSQLYSITLQIYFWSFNQCRFRILKDKGGWAFLEHSNM